MTKQVSFDTYAVRHLHDLLERGSSAVEKTDTPIVLYRQILEEETGSFEEVVCTLTHGHVVEQRIVSGGPVPPNFHSQHVFEISEYPVRLYEKSRERFANVVEMLEKELD